MHVGEPEVAALETVGEFFVVEAELVQQRGVEVVHVNGISHDVEAEVVGLPVAAWLVEETATNAASRTAERPKICGSVFIGIRASHPK